MDWTEDLRWFVTLADLEQVTSAASALGMSQPALSRKLARLEASVGAPLFVRHGRRLNLAAAGVVLRDHCIRALAELEDAERRIADMATEGETTIRLDFLHSFGTWLVPQLIREFRHRFPDARFQLFQGAADLLADRVADGQSDIAVVSPRPRRSDVRWTVIQHQKLALAVAEADTLSSRESVRFTELENESFITMHREFGMRRIFDEQCAEAGMTPRIVFEASELTTIGGLVSAGLGVAIMPVNDAEPPPAGVVLVPFDNAVTARDIGIVTPIHRNSSTPTTQFATYAELSQREGPT
ncbi:putative transcriptional regulator [Rhodococcoides trifolii]|uniref:Transcriptional regulator n=1 Tax=Rhodococcoides trifolii TaxID=908250 RepID=A0A917G4Y4_9NOCA|nr:LysR family transcriptional regulator [Rhodococcus trifolii]GGG22913.1 putative transcriptional regulator [Rhodococcus trifolii]